MTTEPRLPDTLSGLLRVAIDDARRCVEQGHVIDGNMWLMRRTNGKCSVCLAGGVIIQTLSVPFDRTVTLSPGGLYSAEQIDRDTYHKLMALNYLRQGFIAGAARRMGLNTSLINKCGTMSDDPRQFFRQAEALYDRLVEAGE